MVDFPLPINKKGLCSFLGLVGYYRNYIRDCSAIAQPLTDLLQKSKPNQIVWTDNEVTAFKALKNAMIHAPVLRNPDFHRPFILQTDASDFAIGAVLSQKFENGEHPIAFLSSKLLPRERNYSVVEKECLAIVWSTESLNYYLSGQKFTIETDHNPLTWLTKMKDKNQRLLRWTLLLQQYDFKINYRSGASNKNADGMSRV